jgi:hypothetical protein
MRWFAMLDWKPSQSLRKGLKLYPWIEEQVSAARGSNSHARPAAAAFKPFTGVAAERSNAS